MGEPPDSSGSKITSSGYKITHETFLDLLPVSEAVSVSGSSALYTTQGQTSRPQPSALASTTTNQTTVASATPMRQMSPLDPSQVAFNAVSPYNAQPATPAGSGGLGLRLQPSASASVPDAATSPLNSARQQQRTVNTIVASILDTARDPLTSSSHSRRVVEEENDRAFACRFAPPIQRGTVAESDVVMLRRWW